MFQEIIFTEEKLEGRSRQIHENALSRAKKYLIAEAELLEAIIQVDRDQTYKKLGLTHLTPYCVRHLGLSEEVAGNFVRVARKSHQVPELKLAVEKGLNLTKAKTIAAVITPSNHREWIEKAQTLSKEKLEKAVVCSSPAPKKPEKAKVVGENRHRVEFELSDAEMNSQKRAQDLVSQKLGHSATLAETQKFLLEAFLEKHDPVRKADRSRERARVTVKHLVNARDRGQCQATGPNGSKCLSGRWVHLHHLVPKAEGGKDAAENMITLCSAHHRLWHGEEVSIKL